MLTSIVRTRIVWPVHLLTTVFWCTIFLGTIRGRPILLATIFDATLLSSIVRPCIVFRTSTATVLLTWCRTFHVSAFGVLWARHPAIHVAIVSPTILRMILRPSIFTPAIFWLPILW